MRATASLILLLSAVLGVSCTPGVVPVVVPTPDVGDEVRAPFRVTFVGFDRAMLTRGATVEGAIGTKWPIDARGAISQSVQRALRSSEAGPDSPLVTIRLADFDVDWTAQKAGGVSALTLRSVVQLEYTTGTAPAARSGTFVGRGRRVDTGWAPKIDQRLGGDISAVVEDAAASVVSQLVAELQRTELR
jgi:hypothetical protein